MEGIALENFCAMRHTGHLLSTKPPTHNAAFHSFLSDDRKKGYATTYAHCKQLFIFLQNKNRIATNTIFLGKHRWLC